jgi:hypothetical protein
MVDFAKITRPSFTTTAKPRADVPTPFKGRQLRRRNAMVRDVQELLPHLPETNGESLHCLLTGRADLAVYIAVLIDHYARVYDTLGRDLVVATLAFNARNLSELVNLLQSGKVERLTLLVSKFFAAHNRELYTQAKEEAARFPGRWRMAASRSHAKVFGLDYGDGKVVVGESSSNLRSNGSVEQLTLFLDHGLYAWHRQWITETVDRRHEHDPTEPSD